MCLCVFIRMVKWHSMCGQSGPVSATLCNHTHIRSTDLHSASVYPSLSAHTNTRVRPPRLEGNHEKATLCSQTAQCDRSGAPLTPMQQPLPTERSVCLRFYAFVNRPSCILKCTERCAFFAPQSPSQSNSSPKSRRFAQTKRCRVSMSAFSRSSISGIIVLMGAGWEA